MGKRPVARLENTGPESELTSKSPVAPTAIWASTPSFFFRLSARATALGL